ncbi:DUF5343 domain-containing protein [Halalkalibaculum sp. DA384]|uniref:DUF5343 domain-containing protein n=1 Tax=Halalkalibaculum sp. DA384 TaxID=3373606 RepID=UPI003753F241
MALTEKFLVNTDNLEAILDSIRTEQELPDRIENSFLEGLGYENPPDFLILTLLKELRMLRSDNTPTPLLEQFRDPETSAEALAIGLLQAYGELFKKDTAIHRLSIEEITDQLRDCFESPKSEIILKYMARTFTSLVNYIGSDKLEALLEQRENEESNVENVIKEIAQKHQGSGLNIVTTNVISALGTETSLENMPPETSADPEIDNSSVSVVSNTSTENSQKPSEESENKPELNGSEKKKTNNEESERNNMQSDEHHNNGQVVEQEIDTGLQPEATEGAGSDATDAPEAPSTPQAPSTTNAQSRYVDKALIKKAALLHKVGRLNEAIPALDKVFDRFARSEKPELYNQASIALINKMKIVEKLELRDQLLPVYEQLINRLDDSKNSEFSKYVDHAYAKRVDTLLEADKLEQGLEAIGKAIQRFKASSGKGGLLEQAMYKKAEVLESLGRDEDAIEAYDELLGTFDK